jgi:hypothetical protein
MNFGAALEYLKSWAGLGTVARDGWNGKGMWIGIVKPSLASDMDLPYIYMKTADNKTVPWLASQTDILSEDWVVVS